jgi:hypothetical protein
MNATGKPTSQTIPNFGRQPNLAARIPAPIRLRFITHLRAVCRHSIFPAANVARFLDIHFRAGRCAYFMPRTSAGEACTQAV